MPKKIPMIGDIAVMFGVPYPALARLANSRNDLPGQLRVGRYNAFDPAKLDDLRAELVRCGLIQVAATAA